MGNYTMGLNPLINTKYLCVLFSMLVFVQGCARVEIFPPVPTPLPPAPQCPEIKIYTYEEALDLAEDSDGFYNFFLLPGISPDQANTFEEKVAAEWGVGYNVYTGADPYSVEALVRADIPIELLEAYVETLVTHLQAENATKYSTFRASIEYYMTLRKAMRMPADSKKWPLDLQAEAERTLLGLLLMLEDEDPLDAVHRINYGYRLLDRVKFHIYKKKMNDKETSDGN